MMPAFEYKGYLGSAEIDLTDNILHGKLMFIKDIVTYAAHSPQALKTAFEEAVEDYLTTCEKLNRAPQKSYSGQLMLRVPPEIHAAVAMAAQASGKSINQWAAEAFARAVRT